MTTYAREIHSLNYRLYRAFGIDFFSRMLGLGSREFEADEIAKILEKEEIVIDSIDKLVDSMLYKHWIFSVLRCKDVYVLHKIKRGERVTYRWSAEEFSYEKHHGPYLVAQLRVADKEVCDNAFERGASSDRG